MKKKYLAGLCMVLLLTLLVGCIPLDSNSVHIYGYVEDKYDNLVEGIRVTCGRTSDLTDANGRFDFFVHNVEYSQNIELTFTGSDQSFDPLTKKVWITPGEVSRLGGVTMQRNKALVKGEVIYDSRNTYSLDTLDATEVQVPAIDGPAYPEGELIVKFKEGMQLLASDPMIEQMDLNMISQHPSQPLVTFKTRGDMEEVIRNLETRSDVEFAEPNYYVYPLSYSTHDPERDPDMTWNLEAINLHNAWRDAADSSDIIVAVLDTGIRHGVISPDYNILWELGKDFIDNDDDPSVYWESHGTQVADIINNVTEQRVSILPIRILSSANNDGARGTLWELLQGLEYALNNADIINLSVAIQASYSEVKSVDDLLRSYDQQGRMKLIISAAGNDGNYTPTYPASSSYILSVGAVGPTLQPASYTNRGVDLYAPGGDYHLYPKGAGNTIRAAGDWVEGTSIASAHVAGVAAMVLAENPYMSVYELQDRLIDHSLVWSYDDGAGLVDAYGAVKDMDPQRPFIFFEYNGDRKESTYSYYKDGKEHFEIAAVESGYRLLCAWVDRNNNNKVDYGDYYTEQNLSINKGDVIDNIELELEVY